MLQCLMMSVRWLPWQVCHKHTNNLLPQLQRFSATMGFFCVSVSSLCSSNPLSLRFIEKKERKKKKKKKQKTKTKKAKKRKRLHRVKKDCHKGSS